MTTTADLAVVICSRDRAQMLANALATVMRVTPPDVRVLVVDSASSSRATRDVVAAAGAEYLRTDVKGLSIARNLGLTNAEREIVVFTDDDCEPVEGWIAHILAPFTDPKVGAVTGLLLDSSLIGNPIERSPMRFTSTRRGLDAGHGALMAFRTGLADELGGFDEVLGAGRHFAGSEDLDMFCRVLDSGSAIVSEPRAIVHHMNTRDGRAYTALLNGYGLGLGALGRKWLRLSWWTGVQLMGIIVGRALVRLARQLGSARRRNGTIALLRGVFAGFAQARRLRLDGSRFIDDDRPAPTPIDDGLSDTEVPL
jgi:glycosyltransferase involved in cell wall biosynthesis